MLSTLGLLPYEGHVDMVFITHVWRYILPRQQGNKQSQGQVFFERKNTLDRALSSILSPTVDIATGMKREKETVNQMILWIAKISRIIPNVI